MPSELTLVLTNSHKSSEMVDVMKKNLSLLPPPPPRNAIEPVEEEKEKNSHFLPLDKVFKYR